MRKSRPRWGRSENMGFSTLSSITTMICRCGQNLMVRNARAFWDQSPEVTTCPKCRRQHRTRFVVESRAATSMAEVSDGTG